MTLPAFLRRWSIAFLLACAAPSAFGGGYAATLPEEIYGAPDLCRYAPCTEVVPGATSFSERKGRPPYVEAYAGEGEARRLVGYVALSVDVIDTPGYSGKPIVTLVGIDTRGRFTGVRILQHSEPILLLGIPEAALERFNRQYLGKFVGDDIEVGPSRPEQDVIGVDAISGATVTVIAQNQVLMAAGGAIARQVGILEPVVREQARFAPVRRDADWAALVAEGAVQRLVVKPEQVGLPRAREPFIELWFGSLDPPDLGRMLLGDAGWRSLQERLGENDHALFVIRTAGRESFKGSGFVRGGIFDRVQVRQGMDAFTFRDLDYFNLYDLGVPGAPAFGESAIFIVRSPAFSAAYPWRLVFLGNRVDRATGLRSFANFESEYWLPDRYLAGGRPQVARPVPPWLRAWRARAVEIALFAALLVTVAVVFARRDRLTRASSRTGRRPVDLVKYVVWALSAGFIGFHLMAQPSITQVLAWFHSLLFQWKWELFLSDPFIFLFWIFIIATVFVWGRGLFCGWMCPFGSLSELLYKAAQALGLGRFQFKLPGPLHHRLKWVKYGVFFGLLAASFHSMALAERLAEVEPFKTTFLTGLFSRSWPYTLFAAGLLGLSMFTERPFCKYLCPLGAGLAMPSTFRWFGLRRKQECTSCKVCAVGCGSLSIDPYGRIDQRECMLCLDCMVLYTDPHTCPPLAQERKRRERAQLPLTVIDADGYFTPLEGSTAAPQSMRRRAPATVDPNLPTAPVQLAHATDSPWWRWLLGEAADHLWPWSRRGFHRRRTLQAAGLALGAAATAVWVLAAMGQLQAGTVIGAWVGWSVFEVLVRLDSRPYVKEGPWWGRRYRVATWMDMISYVGFKNLLIGATLFLLLKSLGLMAG